MKWVDTPRVLVLDDERVIADTLVQILRLNGCEAEAVYTAEAALERLDDPPDLFVTDVALDPDSINGIDVAIYFQQNCPECRVLLISGHAGSTELLHNARARGHALRLLQKPVHPDDLLNAVSEELEGMESDSEGMRKAS